MGAGGFCDGEVGGVDRRPAVTNCRRKHRQPTQRNRGHQLVPLLPSTTGPIDGGVVVRRGIALALTIGLLLTLSACKSGPAPVDSGSGAVASKSQPTEDCNVGAKNEPGEPHYYVRAKQCAPGTTGISATFSVHKPTVASKDTMSLGQLAIARTLRTGSGEQDYTQNSIEVGWQVYPGLWGDDQPHLFIFPVGGQYSQMSANDCYKTGCGLMQDRSQDKYRPGASLSSLVDHGTIDLAVFREADKWWISVEGARIGYYPTSYWNDSSGFLAANKLAWYGEVAPGPSCTQMGDGTSGTGSGAAVIRSRMIQAKEGWKSASSGLDLVTDRTMYDGRIDGTTMYYGGPGNNNCPPSAAPNTGSGSNPGSGESPHGQGAGGRPDLIPVSSSAEPECGAADLDGSVMNQTSVPTDSFRVAWVVDGAIVKSGTVSDLPPRVAKSGLSVHQYLSPGEHIVKFVVDDTNLIAESDESNNTWTDRVTVPTCRSSPAQPVTPALPNPPSNLTVLSTDSYHIRISWQDDSNNEASFEVNNGNESRTVGQNVTSYVWSSTPGSYMCVRVRAVNSAGASPWEPSVSPFYRCTTTPNVQGSAM